MSSAHAWRALSACTLLAVCANIALHKACDRLPPPSQRPGVLMPPQLVRILSGAHRAWMADVSWLRTVEHQGNPRMQAEGTPQLLPLLQRTVALDPHFVAAYQFLGTAVNYAGDRYEAAMALLHQGMRCCPEAWRIAFFAGFNAYWYGGDYARAAADLAVAARSPAAPPHTAALATRLAAEAGVPEVGLKLVDTLLQQTDDADTAAIAELVERRRRLELDIQTRALEAVCRAGCRPSTPCTWEDLRASGFVQSPPLDPWGAPWLLQNDTPVSLHAARRLRLAANAKGHAHASR